MCKIVLKQYLGFSAYDDIEWIDKLIEYVHQVLADDHVTIIGLCFGHQVVGRALGAKGAINSLGYEMSVCKVDMTPLGAKIFGRDQLVCLPLSADFLVLSGKPLHQHHICIKPYLRTFSISRQALLMSLVHVSTTKTPQRTPGNC